MAEKASKPPRERKRRWDDGGAVQPTVVPLAVALAKAQSIAQSIPVVRLAAPTPQIAANREAMRVYVGSLSYDETAAEVQQLFAPFGTIVSVDLAIEASTGISRCFCFVEFASEESVKAALIMHDFDIGGRKLKVSRPAGYSSYSSASSASSLTSSAGGQMDVQALLSEALGGPQPQSQPQPQPQALPHPQTQPQAEEQKSNSAPSSTPAEQLPTPSAEPGRAKAPRPPRQQQAKPSKFVRVRNVHPEVTAEELQRVLAPFGDIEQCSLQPAAEAHNQGMPANASVSFSSEEGAKGLVAATSAQPLTLAGLTLAAEFAPSPPSEAGRHCVEGRDMVALEDVKLQDPALMADIAQGLQAFGKVLQVELVLVGAASEPVVRIFFSSRAEAQAARDGIDGRLFGGRNIRASLVL
jgi:RNA recognition motif-containing protein